MELVCIWVPATTTTITPNPEREEGRGDNFSSHPFKAQSEHHGARACRSNQKYFSDSEGAIHSRQWGSGTVSNGENVK